MLFPYTYVPHSMEKMQEFIDFIFFEVWCKAPGNGNFRFELFDGNVELKGLMESFCYSDTKGGDFFYGHVEGIYNLFAVLTETQIDQLKQWYKANNDIEKVCANDSAIQIAHYIDIEAISSDLRDRLASFFVKLYSNLDVAALREKIGRIDEHYHAFMQVNTTGKCPFCGIGDMLGVYHTKREAYDHYLPKALYPFNSINFRNLVPACHHCNSSYKTTQDPSYSPKDPTGEINRRKAFYPYNSTAHAIEIQIDLSHSDLDKLNPDDIQLAFGPDVVREEIDTWREVYGIDERFKAKCCDESGGRYWIVKVMDEWQENGRTPSDFMDTLNRLTVKQPLAESNFLQKAFLEGCERAGLFQDKLTQ
ncbi:MAG: hypothetical protein HGA57_09100 [Chlorobium limicola]|uniref:HNH endonuclease n=1 Tax=Chlorobium limicola TaxID=1092 RepID=UPI0023F4A7EC|nr:hypothetical protein [Chlorobium limicola]NTV21522.1 hypothetical protein [Chlorobium limicola]